ncbi:thioredoxin family protein [Vibrio cholerae]|uniref:thioredoxin family protein n=1 Tax=Gammaproteobacteria TaxID=1236 RepID=UPI0007E4FBA1|nr:MULTISPECIES: thioredoxin family protein [Gammaproteobacteria]MDI4653984.1 thioredoxin family protein [Pseudoalteromonas shioyasakiensis]NUJ40767.1 thioredoxin family protein [Pseudoalteromonas sp. 0303]HDL8936159.1 thioredoxin family protein [Vibrio cholerae]
MRTPLFPWFILWVTIPIIIFLLFILPAHASDGQFYQRGQEGWFWYQVIPEPEQPDELIEPEAGVVESSQSELKPFSAAWFREHMQSFMDKAIDEPTNENVRAYLYLQRVMMDKGSLFADVSQQVVMGDPVLDEISRRPLATYAANRMDREAGAQRDVALGEIAKRAGLFFFYRSDCPYCHAQAPIIESMALNYGFKVFAIAVDGLPLPGGEFPNYKVDSGQAQSLSVTTVPAVFLVDPPNVITPIGQGAMSLDELNNRIILAAHQAGWIDDQTYYATRPVQPGVSLAMSAQELNEKILQDPEFLVRYLRAQGGL